MAARSVGDAQISFGLVSIPVRLYTATESAASISFNMLHAACGTRVKQQLYCPTCNVKIERADTVKGYEFEKNKYVQLTADELKAIEQESTHQIDIAEFLPVTQIDPVYFDKAYYLGTDKNGEKAYALLAAALLRSGRAGLGQYSTRGRQYLVIIRARGPNPEDGLVMQQLLYADEIRAFSEVPMTNAPVREQEIKLALQIIDQGARETFDPSGYKDERHEQMKALIDQKLQGQTITAPKEIVGNGGGQIIDLVAALQASLNKQRVGGKERKGPKSAAATPIEKAKRKKS